jgi:hypothetical protein
MIFIAILDLFIFLAMTPRILFAIGHKIDVSGWHVIGWAASGTIFITLKFLV